ncbi:hypothetical protein ACIHJG_39630 [Streptomyces sp. NPDC052415]
MTHHDAFFVYDSPDMPFFIAHQAVRDRRRTTVVAFAAAAP